MTRGTKKEVREGARVDLFITLQDMPGLSGLGGGAAALQIFADQSTLFKPEAD